VFAEINADRDIIDVHENGVVTVSARQPIADSGLRSHPSPLGDRTQILSAWLGSNTNAILLI
jgi:hypothetical protein